MAQEKQGTKKENENLDDLITQSEAAKIRGVSRAAISDLVKRRRLRTKMLFGRALVYRDEVVNFKPEKTGPK